MCHRIFGKKLFIDFSKNCTNRETFRIFPDILLQIKSIVRTRCDFSVLMYIYPALPKHFLGTPQHGVQIWRGLGVMARLGNRMQGSSEKDALTPVSHRVSVSCRRACSCSYYVKMMLGTTMVAWLPWM